MAQYASTATDSAPAGTPTKTGAHWGCTGPQIHEADGIVAAVWGRPEWRLAQGLAGVAEPARQILEAFRHKGAAFLDDMFGGFAVAILRPADRYALLAIDRVGVERLAYAANAHGIVFSRDAEYVAKAPSVQAPIRRQALLSYIYFHMIPAPETVFEGVFKLPPATALEWQGGKTRTFRYWAPAFVPDGSGSFPQLKEGLHTALTTAVRSAHADERTGAFLSGGLDSSTVAGFLANTTPQFAKTFSIGFGFPEYDELHYARIANRQFQCRPTEYEVTADDICDLIPFVARSYDEPFGNASAVPTFCCARLAKQHGVDHLLAGDGGDEIFAGNKRYAEQIVFERYQNVPAPLRALLLEPILCNLPDALAVSVLRKGRNYINQAKTPLPDRFENWNFLHRLGFRTMLHDDFIAAIDLDGPLNRMREVYRSAPQASLVDQMLYYDWHFTLADNDLRKVGRMCELAGVRVSYPMLHQDVLDLSIRVPADMKMRGTELRSFYKDAMADFLPQEIINKRKHGFGLPFGLWLQRSTRLAELIGDNLAGLRSRRIVSDAFLNKLRALHNQDDAHYYGVLIWNFALLEQWFREHQVSV
jgi:asparagine synthase (glutamine-hydrolysing)